MGRTRIVTEHVPYAKEVHVTKKEYRAPTDESIRIYEDMEKKVVSKMVYRQRIDSLNIIEDGMLMIFDGLMMSGQDMYRMMFRFKINGTVYQFEREVNRFEIYEKIGRYKGLMDRKFTEELFLFISQVISAHLMENENFKETVDKAFGNV